jgi:hypothetical protein
MKKLLIIGMICFMSIGVFAGVSIYFKTCTAHLYIVDEDGNTVGHQDATADTCENAVKAAKFWYWFNTGDRVS